MQAQRQNDFSKGSMLRNILNMALPMTVAQLINLLYSVVDRMYLGRLPGHLALTGLGICMPIITMIMAFANLCGMGGSPLCSIYRGKGDDEEAERVMGNAFSLLLIFGASITAICLIFRTPILYLFGASPDTFPYANEYLTVYALGTIFVMIGLGMNPFINSQGFSRMGMLTVILGAAVNIVLDPIFIFALDMGVRGAALATVIAQGCSAVWVLRFLTGRRALLRLRLPALRLRRDLVGRILSLGAANFSMTITNSLVQVLCNATLQSYGGDLYVSIMTVVNSIREVLSMPLQGLTQGCKPVLGYNYGAREYQRVRQGIRITAVLTLIVGLAAWLLVMLFPEQSIRIFSEEAELITTGIPVLRVYFSTFFCMAFQFCGQSVFVALGRPKSGIFFALLRKVFIMAPLILILPPLGLGVDGVFLSEPLANLLSGVICILAMYFTVYRPLGRLEQ